MQGRTSVSGPTRPTSHWSACSRSEVDEWEGDTHIAGAEHCTDVMTDPTPRNAEQARTLGRALTEAADLLEQLHGTSQRQTADARA